MSTKTTAIDGIKFELSAPYAAGHAINEAEAAVLNQVRAENVGNNLRKQIKDAKEANGGELTEAQIDQIKAKVAEYDASYILTVRAPGQPRVTDPVEKEARKLAKDGLRDALSANFSSKAITAALKGEALEDEGMPQAMVEKIQAKLEELCTKGSKVWKTAEANVKKRNEASATILDELGLSEAAE